MSEIEIIRLSVDEWQRYRDIRLEALREEPQAFGSTYADMLQKPHEFWQGRLIDAARGETCWLLFAQQGGRLVGLIGAFIDPEHGQTAKIISVYVNRTARGKGVGKALMAAILNELKQKERIQLAALNVVTDQAAAVALYRSFGFVVMEEEENVEGDGKLHRSYRMEKSLSSL